MINSMPIPKLTCFDLEVLRWLTKLYKGSRERVKTIDIALYVPKHERQIRYALVALEAAGKVQRVGQRRGWLPVLDQPANKKDALGFPKASSRYPISGVPAYSNFN